jgi:hypothetical protein
MNTIICAESSDLPRLATKGPNWRELQYNGKSFALLVNSVLIELYTMRMPSDFFESFWLIANSVLLFFKVF